jgi:hypothetical protein
MIEASPLRGGGVASRPVQRSGARLSCSVLKVYP